MDRLIRHCLACKGRYPIGTLDLKSRRFGCDLCVDGPWKLMHSPKKMKKRKKFSTESWGMIFTGLREGKPTRDEEVLVCWAKGKTGVIMSQNHRGEE